MKQLLKFHATWCQPCKALSANFNRIDLGDVELVEIDIDEKLELAQKYNVRSVPTLILLENNVETKRQTGVIMPDKIEEFIK